VVCVNCSLHQLSEKINNHLILHKNDEILAECLLEQIAFIKNLIQKMKSLLIDSEEIENKIKELKLDQLKKVPLTFERIIKEPYYKKKVSVKAHSEIIKYPVFNRILLIN